MMAQEKHFLKSQEQFETLGELVRQHGVFIHASRSQTGIGQEPFARIVESVMW